jgi:hypothetical protein
MAATLDELLAQYQSQQAYAKSQAQDASSGLNTGLAVGSGILGLAGSIAAPFAAQYIGDKFGLNKRSAAEEQALSRIRDVAEGGRTAAQAQLEYQRARTGRMAAQAAAAGPARERSARQLVGQEQNIAAQQDLAGQAAAVKMQEQARAQQVMADIETRAGEAERQRQRQLVAGAITGGLSALSQAYGGYAAGKLRERDLKSQADAAGAAVNSIQDAMSRGSSALSAAPGAQAAAPVSAATPDVGAGGNVEGPVSGFAMTPAQFQLPVQGRESSQPNAFERSMTSTESPGSLVAPIQRPSLGAELQLGPVPGALDAAMRTGPYGQRRAAAKRPVRTSR